MEKLAIHGGPKVRTSPFPERAPFGQREEELLIAAVRSQNLFGKSGRFVRGIRRGLCRFLRREVRAEFHRRIGGHPPCRGGREPGARR